MIGPSNAVHSRERERENERERDNERENERRILMERISHIDCYRTKSSGNDVIQLTTCYIAIDDS